MTSHGNGATREQATISLDGKIQTIDAARHLECSISNLALLRKKRKLIKAQKINGEWYYDLSEVLALKASGTVRGRRRKQGPAESRLASSASAIRSASQCSRSTEMARLEFSYPKDKYERVKMALRAAGKDPVRFVQDALDAFDEKILTALKVVAVEVSEGRSEEEHRRESQQSAQNPQMSWEGASVGKA